MYMGDYAVGALVDAQWNTQGQGGASITRATNGTVRIYKNNSTTERTSASGITDTEDFDTLTGVHHLRIDLADNADAGFYAAGNEYSVVLVGAVIDGQAVNATLIRFSIERAGGVLALLKAGVTLGNVAHGGAAATITVKKVVVNNTDTNGVGVELHGTGEGARLVSEGGVDAPGASFIGGTNSSKDLDAREVDGRNDLTGNVIADGGNSATTFKTDRLETPTDHWQDAWVRIKSGALLGQTKRVTAYNGTTKFITVEGGFTATPADSIAFVLITGYRP